MFIQTEATPNPLTLKFLPGETVMGEGRTAQITTEAEAAPSPLAQELFKVDGVAGVFLGADFISVTREDATPWDSLKAPILTTIMDHYVAGKPIYDAAKLQQKEETEVSSDANEDDALVKEIKELIDTRVRPAVAMDGGDIIYRGFDDGIVKLELHGACSGCPSSTITLKNGIENMLKHYVPEVQGVEAVAQ